MNRRILLALVLVLGVVAVWRLLRSPAAPPGKAARVNEPAPASGARAAAPSTSPAAAPAAPRTTEAARAERERMLRAIAAAQRRPAAPPPSPAATPRNAPPAEPAPALDKDYVRSRVREIVPLVRECYERALERDPSTSGRIVVEFTIVGAPGVGGLVGESRVRDEGTTIRDPEMRECLQENMYAARFEAPAAGGTVTVTYPFAFANDAPDDGGRHD